MRRRVRLAALLTAMTATLLPVGPALAAPSLPDDPAARGSIGLCDRAGKPVTSGKVTDKPFVWRAVGSEAAPSPFGGKGRSATLYAFQPRPQVPASQWSGDTLTAASSYTNKAHPMAQATQLDFTLRDFLDEYPAGQDGLVQLRLVVGAGGAGAAPVYASAFLRVNGSGWSVVAGSENFSCTDGSSVSTEVDAGIVDKRGNAIGTAAASLSASAAARSSATARGGSASSTPRSGAATSAATSSPAPGSQSSVASSPAASERSGSGAVLWTVVAVVVVVVLAVGGVVFRRGRASAGRSG